MLTELSANFKPMDEDQKDPIVDNTYVDFSCVVMIDGVESATRHLTYTDIDHMINIAAVRSKARTHNLLLLVQVSSLAWRPSDQNFRITGCFWAATWAKQIR
jgi:hypothetical protein